MGVKVTDVQRTFPRRFRGYDPEAVRVHLEQVAEALAAAEREAARLRAENEALRADLGQRYRSEHTVAEALLQAQELAARVKADAEAEAKAVVDAARAEAERVLSVARAEADARRADAEAAAQEAERRLDHLRRLLAEAVSRARAALSGGLEAVGMAEAWLGGVREEGGEGGGAGVFDGVDAP
jgi:SWI/SNF-related matrix-associated actin-dependent regulator 1 of chromatin subfamily A